MKINNQSNKELKCPSCKAKDPRSKGINWQCRECGRYWRKKPTSKLGRPRLTRDEEILHERKTSRFSDLEEMKKAFSECQPASWKFIGVYNEYDRTRQGVACMELGPIEQWRDDMIKSGDGFINPGRFDIVEIEESKSNDSHMFFKIRRHIQHSYSVDFCPFADGWFWYEWDVKPVTEEQNGKEMR